MANGTLEFTSFRVRFEERDDITYDLSPPGERKSIASQPYTLKESCKYKTMIRFTVKENIISGVKCQVNTFRKGLRIGQQQYMLGSFAPKKESNEIVLPKSGWGEAPSGALAKGSYISKIIFVDDDGNELGELETAFDIKSDW